MKEYKLLIIWVLVVIGLWVANLFITSKYFDEGEVTTKTITKTVQIGSGTKKQLKTETITTQDSKKDRGRGTSGDMFGAVNALFTGLGFAGLLFSINLQRKQSDEQEKQFIKQSIDDKFFRLLEHQRNITEKVRFWTDTEWVNGVLAFDKIANYIRGKIQRGKLLETYKIDSELEPISKVIKEKIQYSASLDYYFNVLEALLLFLEDLEKQHKQNPEYFDIPERMLKANLSNNELVILSYYCLFNQKNKELKRLLYHFKLLNFEDIYFQDFDELRVFIKDLYEKETNLA